MSTKQHSSGHRFSVLRTVSLAFCLIGIGAILLLHVIPPTSEIDPLRVTVSQYGRTSLAPLFSAAVMAIATGSVTAAALFVRTRLCRPRSTSTIGLALWALGLVGVAVFPKADWAVGATLAGYLHRGASILAFVALAVALLALIVTDRRRAEGDHHIPHRVRRLVMVSTIAALVTMLALAVTVAIAESAQVAWWTIVPLGLLERALATLELGALVALILSVRGSRPAPTVGCPRHYAHRSASPGEDG